MTRSSARSALMIKDSGSRLSAIPVLDFENITAQNDGNPMVRIAVPPRGVAGSENQSPNDGSSPFVKCDLSHWRFRKNPPAIVVRPTFREGAQRVGCTRWLGST